MYFLSEEEKRLVLRRLLPQARAHDVHPELRGWNWDKPPLSPIYDTRLAIYEIAGKYCPTSRDVYLRRVMGIKVPPSPAMSQGSQLHQILCQLFLAAKRLIYQHSENCLAPLRALSPADFLPVKETETRGTRQEATGTNEHNELNKLNSPNQLNELRTRAQILWDYEHPRIISRVQEVLARYPHIGADSLASLALPLTVEQRLDGSFLGLSPYLSADAFNFAEPMIVDIKFGWKQKFHRLGTTGYALVTESLHEYPVNLGCLVYASFKDNRLTVERDFHLIDDELRQWFIEERDERMRMVSEEIDPGVAKECPVGCPYQRECHPA